MNMSNNHIISSLRFQWLAIQHKPFKLSVRKWQLCLLTIKIIPTCHWSWSFKSYGSEVLAYNLPCICAPSQKVSVKAKRLQLTQEIVYLLNSEYIWDFQDTFKTWRICAVGIWVPLWCAKDCLGMTTPDIYIMTNVDEFLGRKICMWISITALSTLVSTYNIIDKAKFRFNIKNKLEWVTCKPQATKCLSCQSF